MTALNLSAPAEPICRTVDGKAPCPFSHLCHESRQRTVSGWVRSLGQWVQRGEPLWGDACWAYGHFSELLGTEAQQERAAIQEESR